MSPCRTRRCDRRAGPGGEPREWVELRIRAESIRCRRRGFSYDITVRLSTATGKTTWHASTARMVLTSQDASPLLATTETPATGTG